MLFVAEFINPICLPPPEFEDRDFVGYFPSVAGWERTEENRRTLFSIIMFMRLFREFAKITDCKNLFFLLSSTYEVSPEEKGFISITELRGSTKFDKLTELSIFVKYELTQ